MFVNCLFAKEITTNPYGVTSQSFKYENNACLNNEDRNNDNKNTPIQ